MSDLTYRELHDRASALSRRIDQINEACATAASIATKDMMAARAEIWREIERRQYAVQPAQSA